MEAHYKKAAVAGSALLLIGISIGIGLCYRTLEQAKAEGTAAWKDITQIHAQRAQTANMALTAVASPGGLDPVLVEQTRSKLVKATAMPTGGALLDDPRAIDDYKRYQGELTGALFMLAARPLGSPSAQQVQALAELRQALPRNEAALDAARARYAQAASNYNAIATAFPGNAVAAMVGYQPLPVAL